MRGVTGVNLTLGKFLRVVMYFLAVLSVEMRESLLNLIEELVLFDIPTILIHISPEFKDSFLPTITIVITSCSFYLTITVKEKKLFIMNKITINVLNSFNTISYCKNHYSKEYNNIITCDMRQGSCNSWISFDAK